MSYYRTASGAIVELLPTEEGEHYRVRYVETGAIRVVLKEAVHESVKSDSPESQTA